MLAIFRLSNGLNGFGDFGVLLLPDCGVLIVDEKRWEHLVRLWWKGHLAYIDSRFSRPAEVVISIFAD